MRFDPGAIGENRAGRLTPSQAEDVRAYQRGFASRDVPIAAMMILIVVIANALPARRAVSPLEHVALIAAGIGVVAIALLSIWRVIAFGRDIAEGKVLSTEGSARRQVQRGRNVSSYFIVVGGKRLRVVPSGFEMIEPMRTYRAYYLPRSTFVVNLETLS